MSNYHKLLKYPVAQDKKRKLKMKKPCALWALAYPLRKTKGNLFSVVKKKQKPPKKALIS